MVGSQKKRVKVGGWGHVQVHAREREVMMGPTKKVGELRERHVPVSPKIKKAGYFC